jgi:hypothetical protein
MPVLRAFSLALFVVGSLEARDGDAVVRGILYPVIFRDDF